MLFADQYGFIGIGQLYGEKGESLKILLVNQAFLPDTVSSGQHAADLAAGLAGSGHQVTVLASSRGYDRPGVRFTQRETWQGVDIVRIRATGFGKGARWRRAADFGSFLLNCSLRMARMPRFDLVICMSSPPLLSAIAGAMARLKKGSLICWVLDLNPDEAIVAGWLNPDSLAGKLLTRAARFGFASARKIVAMDRFMATRIAAYGFPAERIAVIPPWSHDDAIRYDAGAREQFRHEHGLNGQFVVMYSGNHSPCHPLDTLLEAAQRLKNDPRVVFCFIGGGSEFARVKAYAAGHRLSNIVCLPYVPLDRLAGSLSAADLHTVVMGDRYVGVVHPCKVYNVMALGIPFLYIGPNQSHITDLASSPWMRRAAHGDADLVVDHILASVASPLAAPLAAEQAIGRRFSQHSMLPLLFEALGICGS